MSEMPKMPEPIRITRTEDFGGETIEHIYRKAKVPMSAAGQNSNAGEELNAMISGFCPPFNPHTYDVAPGIICEQDVAVKMRDGVTIYCDIFRPVTDEKIPVLISWSFYGKRPGDGQTEWKIMGVGPGTVSTAAKFESPDPLYWCKHGYAVTNVDPRGVEYSEGDVTIFGSQDGRDGYDFIEWIAQQPWCNGKVGMSGNSAVAMSQWGIAATCPPHLAAIAPWEGSNNMFRQSLYEGGVPALAFNEFIVTSVVGNGYVDDVVAMAQAHPFYDAYWKDKEVDFSKIKIPVYATACWNHFHLHNSIDAFRKILSRKKWLRVHREFEWPDAYNLQNLEELRHFFDRYLKDVYNCWESTPRVRLEVQDALEFNYATNRPEDAFPMKRTQYRKLYLDAGNNALSWNPVETESSYSYDGKTGVANFDIRFDEDIEISGYMKLRLWVAAESHNEADLFVNIQKLDTEGEWLPVSVLGEPHPGAWGKQRVSRRALDPDLSTDFEPVLLHQYEEKLTPGEAYPVEIAIVPHSRFWHAGQSLRIQVAGRYIREGWFEPLMWEPDNEGNHIIYSGGKYDSYLQVPVIPAKYRDGDILYGTK